MEVAEQEKEVLTENHRQQSDFNEDLILTASPSQDSLGFLVMKCLISEKFPLVTSSALHGIVAKNPQDFRQSMAN